MINYNTFLGRAYKKHGDKFLYKDDYKNYESPFTIECPEHGEFKQVPKTHILGHGCPKCSNIQTSKKLSSNSNYFIQKAKELFGDKFKYEKVKYINNRTFVTITCKEHGDFVQKPNYHLLGNGWNKKTNIRRIYRKIKFYT